MAGTWSFGGTDLTSAGAYKVIDFASANELPPVRSDNPEIPLREGRLHTEKLFDQRTLSLGMYLNGTSITDFESKLETFKQLFGSRTRQYLQRTMADTSIRRALAEVTRFDVAQKGSMYAKLSVDFLLAEPFFRSVSATIDTQVISASPLEYELTNPGTAPDKSALIEFIGPLNYPKLTNLENGVYVAYNDAIADSVITKIYVDTFQCLQGTTVMLDKLVHSGDAYFMVLLPGSNTMKLETNTTGGSVRITFYPPWL